MTILPPVLCIVRTFRRNEAVSAEYELLLPPTAETSAETRQSIGPIAMNLRYLWGTVLFTEYLTGRVTNPSGLETALRSIDWYVTNGADPNECSAEGWTALHVAIHFRRNDLYTRWLAAGADIDQTCADLDNGETQPSPREYRDLVIDRNSTNTVSYDARDYVVYSRPLDLLFSVPPDGIGVEEINNWLWNGRRAYFIVEDGKLFIDELKVATLYDESPDDLAMRSVFQVVFGTDTQVSLDKFSGVITLELGKPTLDHCSPEWLHHDTYVVLLFENGVLVDEKKMGVLEMANYRLNQLARFKQSPEYSDLHEQTKEIEADEYLGPEDEEYYLLHNVLTYDAGFHTDYAIPFSDVHKYADYPNRCEAMIDEEKEYLLELQ
ncbi:MAG: ankyrin repeat domain-containing protein [Gammaproteobacteria bacterium]|nr:ankyrin repeat domain-containing protein [Gammaproteobacteria bacterium]